MERQLYSPQIGNGFQYSGTESFPEMGNYWEIFERGDFCVKAMDIGDEDNTPNGDRIIVLNKRPDFPMLLRQGWRVSEVEEYKRKGFTIIKLRVGDKEDKYILFSGDFQPKNGIRRFDDWNSYECDEFSFQMRQVVNEGMVQLQARINGVDLPTLLNNCIRLIGIRRDENGVVSALIRGSDDSTEIKLHEIKKWHSSKFNQNIFDQSA